MSTKPGTFQPGNSSGGRTKMPDELKAAFRAASPAALETLLEIMTNGESESNRLKAAEVVLDRGYGKPVQAIEADVIERRSIVYDAIANEPDDQAT